MQEGLNWKLGPYFLVGQKPENQVYFSMFLNIFSISHKKVKVICNNKATSTEMITGDQRGKHGQQRKVSISSPGLHKKAY